MGEGENGWLDMREEQEMAWTLLKASEDRPIILEINYTDLATIPQKRDQETSTRDCSMSAVRPPHVRNRSNDERNRIQSDNRTRGIAPQLYSPSRAFTAYKVL